MARMKLLLLILSLSSMRSSGQSTSEAHTWYRCPVYLLVQHLYDTLHSAALDSLIGIQGHGFVLLAADPLLHRSLVVMRKDRDKIPVLTQRRLMAIGGPPYLVDAISDILRAEVKLLERKLRHPLSTNAIAHMCRNLFLEYGGLPCTILMAGYNEEVTSAGREGAGPCLLWMDTLGAIKRLRFAAHGEAASFLISFLDQQCGPDDAPPPSLGQAMSIMRRCYQELERRYLVNPGGKLQVKVVDRQGCRVLDYVSGEEEEEGKGKEA